MGLAECRECHCVTGGAQYCFEHAPYTVWPKADGSFLVDRNGRRRISFDELPTSPDRQALQRIMQILGPHVAKGVDYTEHYNAAGLIAEQQAALDILREVGIQYLPRGVTVVNRPPGQQDDV